MKKTLLLAIPLIGFPLFSDAQQRLQPANLRPDSLPTAPSAIGTKGTSNSTSSASGQSAGSTVLSSDYVLGPGDLLTLSEVNLEETSTSVFADKTFRVDNSGDVTFPLTGRVHVAGLTTVQVGAEVNQRLSRILKDPQAVVGVAEFHSQPVSVLGAVNSPGIIQISNLRNLFEVVSLAGGLRPDAGNSIIISRSTKSGSIPLSNAKVDSTGQFTTAWVKVKDVISGTDPSKNIVIMPEDTVTVPKAEVVYAVGGVSKPGGFIIGESGTLSALQVISLAEGLLKTASPSKAQILRAVPGSSERLQIAVNVKELLKGKAADMALQPDDILFIPNSEAKGIAYQSVSAIVSLASGAALYGKF